MWQTAIDLGRYFLAAIIGAAVLFAVASAGVVEVPNRRKRRRITAENCAAAQSVVELPAVLEEGPEPRHVRETVLPLKKRSELGRAYEKAKAGSIEDALRGVPL
jgi:hypothetical protein